MYIIIAGGGKVGYYLAEELLTGDDNELLVIEKSSARVAEIADRLDDIAQLAVFLASDESTSCTGADFVIDGGNTAGRILPEMPRS